MLGTTSSRDARGRLAASIGLLLTVSLSAAGCGLDTSTADAGGKDAKASTSPSPKPVPKVQVAANVRDGASKVGINRVIKVTAKKGTLDEVTLKGAGKTIMGTVSDDQKTWTAEPKLLPKTDYTLFAKATDAKGLSKTTRAGFHTRQAPLDQLTYPSFYPDGGTYGIGIPVVIRFDVPVKRKAAIERHLKVITHPAQPGSFHWFNDNEVHWRPKTYWKAGTSVTVEANIGDVVAGHRVWGQKDRETSFTIGRAQIDKVDINTDQLTVQRDGKVINTIPITTGEPPDFTTRSGIKVISEKYPTYHMNSETIGIDPNSSNGYDLQDVEYAMRLTNSGEFLHAAPWSVWAQGSQNVSHGCTGMSTSNAAWLYDASLIGDPVEYTGSSRYMTLDNGLGDWNMSYKDYKKGSALR